METVRALAERFHDAWLAAHPLAASRLGIADYDDRMPDESAEGVARRRDEVASALAAARALEAGARGDDAITLACVRTAAEGEIDALDAAVVEHTVTPMPYHGPALLLATAARTVPADVVAAEAYLRRLERAGTWIDQLAARLATGLAKGRVPVGTALDQTIAWTEKVLVPPVPLALQAPDAPAGWSGRNNWRERRDRVAAEVVRPALARYLEALRALRPGARPAERCGLVHLPGGEEDYAAAIRTYTTLPFSAGDLHETGLEEVARLEDRCRAVAAEIGIGDLDTLREVLRRAAAARHPADALGAARDALRRAEGRVDEVVAPPLPPPCAVTEMPHDVAASGAAPHYSPPRLDGSRPGTYWFNTERPTAGTGFDLESVAFHEAVPGHHLQLARTQLLIDLPAIQRQRSVPVHSEGWALYAEQLAEEIGLYSSTEALLGAGAAALLRAARLVVDTGMHARGWGRGEALAYFVAHVPLPESFLADEIDRYVAMPGQALAYQTGKREILRLRDEARAALGAGFDLRGFHGAVLGHGFLPLAALRRSVTDSRA